MRKAWSGSNDFTVRRFAAFKTGSLPRGFPSPFPFPWEGCPLNLNEPKEDAHPFCPWPLGF